jgi:diguanylate cyclase (GGDEF)-like protein
MFDIDDFKSYNDTYGHLEGDRVIIKVAEIMEKGLRSMDSSFRFGGEEFLVLLPDTDEEGALIVAERIRKRFNQVSFTPQGVPLKMSLSIGVARYKEGFSLENTLRCSDLAMYQAKKNGKNRTVLYGSA